MFYAQEPHVPTSHPQTAKSWWIKVYARGGLALLLLLAFLHGSLYALFLPPWGLIDEAQHLHYIQYIAEKQAMPVAGELYLSDEIVNSLFARAVGRPSTGLPPHHRIRNRWGWRGIAMKPINHPSSIWR